MEVFLDPGNWIALLTLTLLEIVLGIDNVIFISLVSNQLPEEKRSRTRVLGLSLALVFRVAMLLGITWIIQFDENFLIIFENGISGRDIILAVGGLFLIAKSTSEITNKLYPKEEQREMKKGGAMIQVILQIVLLDIIFSFDSILTAIGMTKFVELMIAAVIISMFVMLIFSEKISAFIERRPTLQILALAFLILIGFMLLLEAVDIHIPKGYIYFAVFFSLIVEMVNIRIRRKTKPIHLHQRGEEARKNQTPNT